MPRSSVLALIVPCLALGGCGGSHEPPRVGAPCEAVSDCASGLSCVRDYPGGYCTRVCEDEVCPSGASCDPSTSPPLCVIDCEASSECRDGYQCWRGGCRPQCARDADCGVAGARCDEGTCVGPECGSDEECGPSERCASGSCVVVGPDAGRPQPLGAPCTADVGCESGICAAPELGGICTRECAQASDCVEVGEAACSAVRSDSDGGAPDAIRTLCVTLPAGSGAMGRACASDAECEARVCLEGQCTEVCDGAEDCLRGQTCATVARADLPGATFLACGYAPRAGALAIEEHDLGEFDLAAGRAASFELATPPDAVSITLQARRVGGDPLALSFFAVDDPSDARIFDIEEILAFEDPPERWLPFGAGESITMLVPNTSADRLAFVPGVHSFSVATVPRTMDDTGSARVRVSALVKRAAARPVASGAIDLDVFLVGVGVSAAGAPTHTRLQGALARLEAIVSSEAGVSIGSVAYHDVTGADATRYQVIESTVGETSELAGLFRLSASRSGRRLSVFLVRSITNDGGGAGPLGIAGGIPGPVGMHGTQHSGVVAAFDAAVVGSGTTGANVVGHVLAHEISHYLGLFHSTEQPRPCDPGESPEEGCAPFGGGDTLADTARGDMTNLMYWSIVGAGTNDRLSAGQAFVLRLSALAVP